MGFVGRLCVEVDKTMYRALLPARKALVLLILSTYPDTEDIDDLPQELVHSFNMLTKLSWGGMSIDFIPMKSWWPIRHHVVATWANKK